jgi:two-component system sensor histidine kinase/response regulator
MLPHELRTPLNGILAYGEILASDAETLAPAEIAEMGQVIYQSGKRLENLVENFLIYAQLELLGSDPQKLQALRSKLTKNSVQVIEKHAMEAAGESERSADISFELADLPLPISEDYLGKIVAELVRNACKFSSAQTPVRVTLADAGEATMLTVIDQGKGFSTEHITKVGAYMQFDRKLHEQQGLGLGLAICKRLTELHGGGLTIQSKRGAGATVVVKLPKAKAA